MHTLCYFIINLGQGKTCHMFFDAFSHHFAQSDSEIGSAMIYFLYFHHCFYLIRSLQSTVHGIQMENQRLRGDSNIKLDGLNL